MVKKMNKNSKSEFNLITFFHGIMMGAADAVPGVSGGTIALILGIYSKFIESISNCLYFVKNKFPTQSKDTFISSFTFLSTLAIGMLFSYYFVTKLLVNSDDTLGLLERKTTAPFVYAFFFGLVLFSVREPWNLITSPKIENYLLFAFGILVIMLYTSSNFAGSESNNFLIICGAFALTAMLLPGISGSLVLLTLGQYTRIASTFHDLDFIPLGYFIIGGLVGLVSFVPLMNYAMKHYLARTMSLLAGFMFGSLITLWPWKENYVTEGLSPNLGLNHVFDDYQFLSILLTLLFVILGAFCSLFIKNLESKVES